MPQKGDDLPTRTEDRVPDCVLLEMNAVISSKSTIDLYLYITFDEMRHHLPLSTFLWFKKDWSFDFGLRRGELQLKLDNLSSPPKSRRFRHELESKFSSQRTTARTSERSSSEQRTKTTGATVDAKFAGEKSSAGASGKRESSKSEGEQDKSSETIEDQFEVEKIQVHTKGGRNRLKWGFENKKDDPYLQGTIDGFLAKLKIQGEPFALVAKFIASDNDLVIQSVNGNAFRRINDDKKKAMIRNRLRVALHESIKDYLSKVEIRSVSTNVENETK